MPNGMDYSLLQRVIDGTGMILDTEPGTPDDVGTYVTENQLADWIKEKILFAGYYHNGNFYSDSGHTTLLAKVNGALYIDQTNANKALYVCLSSTYQSLTEEAQVQAIRTELQNGTLVPLKATQDSLGNQIDTTYAKKADLQDGTLEPLISTKSRQDQNGNVIDQTYETKAEASDLKSALTAIDHRVQNLEQAKGDYVAVDSTKGVISVPSGKGKWAVVEKLRGVSRAKNNLLSNGNFATTTGWSSSSATFSVSDNVATVTPIGNNGQIEHSHTFITGHSYLVFADIKLSSANATTRILAVTDPTVSAYAQSNTNWQQLALVCTVANGGNGYVMARDNSSQSPFNVRNYVVRDLNVVFGTSDLSFLGATDSAKLATIQTYYPWLLEPSDYGSSLVDSVYEGVKSKFFNLWDEEYLLGYYNFYSEGVPFTSDSSQICSKNKIEIGANRTLFFKVGSLTSGNNSMMCFDSDDNYLGRVVFNFGSTAITLAGTAYIKVNFGASGLANVGNICINISDASLNGTYKPYHAPVTLSLPTTITLRSAGSVAEEFDLKTGEKTKNVDNKNGTELSWTWYGQTNLVFAQVLGAKIGNAQFICNLPYQQTQGATGMIDKACGFGGNNDFFYIRDTSLTQAQLTAVAESLDINYELATPTTEQLDPIQNPTILTEAGGTISAQTEEPIDGNFSVGFITL